MVGYHGIVNPYRTAGASLFRLLRSILGDSRRISQVLAVSDLSIVDMRYPYSAVHLALREFGQKKAARGQCGAGRMAGRLTLSILPASSTTRIQFLACP